MKRGSVFPVATLETHFGSIPPNSPRDREHRCEHEAEIQAAANEVTGLWSMAGVPAFTTRSASLVARHREAWVMHVPPKPLKSRLSVVRCQGHGAPGDPILAELWPTDYGPLLRAQVVYSHDVHQGPDDPLVMEHPDTGNVSLVARRAFEDVWIDRGWREAPPGTEPPKRFRGQYGVLVYELLDVAPDQGHPALQVRCKDHGDLELNPVRLRKAVRALSTGQLDGDVVPAAWVCIAS